MAEGRAGQRTAEGASRKRSIVQLVGRRRVLDSTALYDAVATMDTVTLIRSAIRGVLKACAGWEEQQLRAVLTRDDEYRTAGKPSCDWEDRTAREAVVDALARDARAVLGVLDGRELEPALEQAAELLATVVGQDLERARTGAFGSRAALRRTG